MMEITAIGMGLMMTAVAVAVAGLMLEATLLMLGRSVRDPRPAALLRRPPSI
ncbi:MAG TPA: hypothetical protein VGV87_19585 [Blastocatellia bacterium]|jgi:hypothetical protein|nr:hypothetical protein [Blastocatellia bacterium]